MFVVKITPLATKQSGHKTRPIPWAPPSFSWAASLSRCGNIVGMRLVNSPRTMIPAQISLRRLGRVRRIRNLMLEKMHVVGRIIFYQRNTR